MYELNGTKIKDLALTIVKDLAEYYVTSLHPTCPYCGICVDDGEPFHEAGCLFEKFLQMQKEVSDGD